MEPEIKSASDAVRQHFIDQYTEIARLAGALAHEIKSPLSTIRLTMEVLAEDFHNPESLRERRALDMTRTVVKQCHRLENILNQFLMFAKAPSIKPIPSSLNDEVTSALDFYKEKAKQANVEITTYLSGNLPNIMLDRDAFQSVLLNLLTNAQAAMPEGGQVLISTYPLPDGVGMDMIDNGCGMDAQTLERLFDAFYTTKKYGFGLGLPTVKKIMEAHDGIIEVQSELRRGTKFTLKFPTPALLPGDYDSTSDESHPR